MNCFDGKCSFYPCWRCKPKLKPESEKEEALDLMVQARAVVRSPCTKTLVPGADLGQQVFDIYKEMSTVGQDRMAYIIVGWRAAHKLIRNHQHRQRLYQLIDPTTNEERGKRGIFGTLFGAHLILPWKASEVIDPDMIVIGSRLKRHPIYTFPLESHQVYKGLVF